MKTVRRFCTLALVVTLSGCPASQEESGPDDAVTPEPGIELISELASESQAPGGIKVVVGYAGAPPEAKPLDLEVDPFCAKLEKLDTSVLVADGKLQNAVVRIAGEVESEVPAPEAPVVVRQTECVFEPRVSAARAGQTLRITNEDVTMYMVQAYRGEERKSWFNTAQPPGAPPIERELEAGMVQLKCGSHPWMAGFVSVSAHPFNAVTGADGAVSFEMVPSGSEPYRVEVWHETLGKRSAEVKVEPGKVAEVIVTYGGEAEK